MFNFFKKSDSEIQQDVTSEMMWDPSLTTAHLSVTVNDGIVSLRGSVPHYFEKTLAEKAAQRVGGVRAVANEIEVRVRTDNEKSDEEIAEAALTALEWNYQVPDDLKVSVDKGWVTLRGEVEWDYQRTAAKNVVSRLVGVHGVSDRMTLKARTVQPAEVKTRIEEALKRSAEIEGRKINVKVDGSKVVLSGNVHSFAESEDARFAAWNAPGVLVVENNLKLAP